MSYVEGSSLHIERGGASTFARFAFDEFVSFIAGWAILLDYAIVLALVASAVPNYLSPFWSQFEDKGAEMIIPVVLIVDDGLGQHPRRQRGERCAAACRSAGST